ncbi:MAG: hypothetical protein J6R88_01620 [Clostridia bacterium]|nr:hypothetical protein [Clostridia bacterium]
MKKIYVCDQTLRVLKEENKKALSFREKLQIATNLVKTGVDAIELPFISLSKEDSVIYRTIAKSVGNVTVCMPCNFSVDGVREAYDCVKEAENFRLQIVVPVSTVQMEYVYHVKAPKMLEKVAEIVKYAVSFHNDVEVIMKDASRAENGFVKQLAEVCKTNGANVVTLCDDGGVYFPEEFANLVSEVCKTGVKVFVQPSDALNMATATAINCIKAGASGIKTASTTGLTLKTDNFAEVLRAKGNDVGITSNLDITAIHNVVKNIEGGIENAKDIDVSVKEVDTLSLDENSTITDIITATTALGYELSYEDSSKVYEEFKRVINKKSNIGARELEAIIATSAMQVPSTYHLVNYVVNSGNIITATANVTLEKDGEKISGVSTGDGPIDAAFHAIEQIVGHHYELDDFQVQAVTKGREAVGSSIIRLRDGGKLYSGNGISTDVVGACIRAYVNALNKIVYGDK